MLQVFLTKVVGEGQLSASRSVLIPREIVRCIRCVIGRMGARIELPAEENKIATPTENRTVVIRSYSPYHEVEILRDFWLQLRCVWNARKYRQRCIVATGGTHSSQWDDGLSTGNCRNNKRNILQLTLQHRPDDNEIIKCYHRPLLMPVELVRNLVAHGDAREGKGRGNWQMEWVASTLTPSPNVVYPALLKLMRTPWLPAVDWTDAPTDLNGLVRFGERRNLVSAHVPSRSARAIHIFADSCKVMVLVTVT